MGTRGRPRRKESSHERQAEGFRPPDEIHKRRADIIAYSTIFAAIWSVANVVANSRGVLPYDLNVFVYIQVAIFVIYWPTAFFIFYENKNNPVYGKAYWMLIIYHIVVALVWVGVG